MTKPDAIKLLKKMVITHEHLKDLDAERGEILGADFIDARIEALRIAIESLEIDVQYDLEYEKTKEAAEP